MNLHKVASAHACINRWFSSILNFAQYAYTHVYICIHVHTEGTTSRLGTIETMNNPAYGDVNAGVGESEFHDCIQFIPMIE